MPETITIQPGRNALDDIGSGDVLLNLEPTDQITAPIRDDEVTEEEKKNKKNNDLSSVFCYDDDNCNIFFICECFSWLFHNCGECLECCCTGCCECVAEVCTACSECDCDCDCTN